MAKSCKKLPFEPFTFLEKSAIMYGEKKRTKEWEDTMLKRKDLLGLIDASASEITEILDLAQEYKNRIRAGEKKIAHLDGKTVTVLFYENSTRTRTSFEEAAKYLGKKPEDLKVITCHLGNGSSIAAVKGGKSIDTSMGFTPLAGVPMGTRSGDIDPAVVEYLAQKKGMTVAETITYLNKKGGVAGVSGVSSDFRDLRAARAQGNKRASLALDMFAYACKKYIGAYAAAMNGVDCIVFTAGVGENTPSMIEAICGEMDYIGLEVDKEKNAAPNNGQIRDVTGKNSKVHVLIIPTNEELVIARETVELL